MQRINSAGEKMLFFLLSLKKKLIGRVFKGKKRRKRRESWTLDKVTWKRGGGGDEGVKSLVGVLGDLTCV